jgi:hypothetical protein
VSLDLDSGSRDPDFVKVVKFNAVCWKMYVGGVFCGSHSTEQHANARRDQIMRAAERWAERKKETTGKAEKEFMDSLHKIVMPSLAKLPPAERAARLKNLRKYLESLTISKPDGG